MGTAARAQYLAIRGTHELVRHRRVSNVSPQTSRLIPHLASSGLFSDSRHVVHGTSLCCCRSVTLGSCMAMQSFRPVPSRARTRCSDPSPASCGYALRGCDATTTLPQRLTTGDHSMYRHRLYPLASSYWSLYASCAAFVLSVAAQLGAQPFF